MTTAISTKRSPTRIPSYAAGTGRTAYWHNHKLSYDRKASAPERTGLLRSTPSIPRTHKYVPSSTALGMSALKKQALFAPKPQPVASSLSSMGFACQSEINDFSAFSRTAAGLPIKQWMDSKFYPDTPNSPLLQLLGFTTGTHGPLGIYNTYQSIQATKEALRVGDKRGAALGVNDVLTSAAQAGLGFGYDGIRVGAVAQMVHPHSERWADFTNQFGMVGNISGAALYGLVAVGEFMNHPARIFKKSLEEKLVNTANKVDYLKNRLGLDEKKLRAKALKDKTPEDLRREGLEALRPFAQRNVELLQKHQKVRLTGSMRSEDLDHLVSRYLGSKVIEEQGRMALVEKMRAKKVRKMVRELGGEEGYKAAMEAVLKPGAKNAEVEKIVLAKIDENKWNRNKRILLFGAGAVVMTLMCIFTAGVAAAVLAGLYALVALGELYLSHQRVKAMAEERTAPGTWDKVIPALSIGLAVGGVVASFVLASVFSFGIAPLIIGVVIAALWIGRNIYHFYAIDKRRENYMEDVLAKKTISIQEMAYLAEYLPEAKLLVSGVVDKLPKADREAIKKHLRNLANEPDFSSQNYGKKLKEAIKRHDAKLEAELVKNFWGKQNERNWMPPGMIALSAI